MNKTLFVHAGTVKTGSSALQYALVQAHDELLRRGYNFPDTVGRFDTIRQGKPTGGNAGPIREALQAKDVDAAINFIRPFADGPHHLILSNEGLFQTSALLMKGLCEAVRQMGFETKCLVFFRPQIELVVSGYLQKIKAEKHMGLSLDEFALQQVFEKRRDWLRSTEQLEQAFGPENVTVKWYPALPRPNGVVQAAFEWLGVPTPAVATPTVNPTPGREALMILLRVNSCGVGGRRFADPFLLRAERRGLLGNKVTLSADTAKKIHDATRPSNEELFRRYFPELAVERELAPPTQNGDSELDTRIVQQLVGIATEVLRERRLSSSAIDEVFGALAPLEMRM